MSTVADHDKDYTPAAFMEYSYEEFGQWVSLLMKRAEMRTTPEKMMKDIDDARNYLRMMDAKLQAQIKEMEVNG